ncbi:GntP family permease [Marinactinospora thermotolerans]|uniref:Gluconate:H+ symporter, GntP family n=1 Tax=Marinactinospora thermotolerans DSM 45154 TaxID=1122192 RepID=A0A1T4SCS0_9ACTN|nr:gluconate:H+ symporter [Marinactinospora thermotolerans]SKA25947.1 gluconate:H+ symporter, GntP family [Marinactinospora thermotolerans DSM 45154]
MTALLSWLHGTTPGLLLLCAAAIAVLLFLIIKIKLEPFVSLLISGLFLALAAGLGVNEIVGTALSSSESLLETGFGGILGHIAPIIGLGTVLGAILERSGGADVLTRRLLKLFGPKGAPVAMGLAGLIFGIPVFFDIGIFVLAPLVYVAAKRGGRSLVLYALPLLAGLSMTHAFLPPHPGPTAAAGLLGVGLGWLIVMGFVCGIPAFVAAGIAWPLWIAPRVPVSIPDDFLAAGSDGDAAEDGPRSPVSLATVALVIAIPLLLILGATFGTIMLPEGGTALQILTFLGNPAVALTIAVLLAFYLLGVRRGMTVAEFSELTGASLRPVGMILLVVGAGAFFGKVISATGVGSALAETLSGAGLPLIVLAYVISCGLRIAQGSATVAIVTTGGIVSPLVAGGDYSQVQLALLAVAIAAGSIIASHVNDGGFWIIAKYFNMSVKDTLKTWTVLETILSVVGFAMAGLLWLLV